MHTDTLHNERTNTKQRKNMEVKCKAEIKKEGKQEGNINAHHDFQHGRTSKSATTITSKTKTPALTPAAPQTNKQTHA